MRKLNMWVAAGLWALLAVLMPMSALEPVGSARAAGMTAEAVAVASCDGGTRLAMGCDSIHL